MNHTVLTRNREKMGSDSITVQNDVIGPYPNDSCKVLFQVCKIKFINYIFREIFQ